jgi:hypothetical protein
MLYFIYETTNLINNKKYRGLHCTDKVTDKYLGSGIALKKAIKKYGKENFERTILEYCNSFEELLNRESFYVDAEWIQRADTYNMRIGGICSIGRRVQLTDEAKQKISNTLREKYKSGTIVNPNKGKVFGKQTEEHIKKAKEARAKVVIKKPKVIKEKVKQVAWNKGKSLPPITEEQKIKISETLKKRYKNKDHHSKGKPSWNKGLTGGVAWNKGKTMEKQKCPHCDVWADNSNLKRWHLDKCRYKK